MRKLIVTILIFLFPLTTFGAVAFDVAGSQAVSPGTSQSVTLTVANQPNRVLIVIYFYDSNTTAGTAPTGAGATWALAASGTYNPASPVNGRMEVWYGTNPSTGSQTVVGHLSPSAVNGMEVFSFNGVDQTTPIAGFTTQNSTSNPFLLTLTTTNGDAVVSSAVSGSRPLGSAAGACNGANDATDQAPSALWYVNGHCLASGASTAIGFTNPGANAGQVAFVVKQVSTGAVKSTHPKLIFSKFFKFIWPR